MDREHLVATLNQAEELASTVEQRYQVAAFQVLAGHLLSGTSSALRPVGTTAQAAGRDHAQLPDTVNEVLALLHDRAHTDRFEAVMFHALKQGDADSVSTDEILAAYSAARLARPSNPSDVVAKCFRKGHAIEGTRRDGQRTWRLTVTGERYVEELLREATSTNE